MTRLLEEKLIAHILEAALDAGADFAEIFAEDTAANTVRMTDAQVEDATYARKRGVGIRVARDLTQSYAYTADLRPAALEETLHAALEGLRTKTQGMRVQPMQDVRKVARCIQKPFDTVTNARRVEILRDMSRAAAAVDEKIVQTSASYIDVMQRVWIANSLGVRAFDARPRTRVVIQAVASNGTDTQTGAESPGFGTDFRAFDTFDGAMYARRAADVALTMLRAPECPAGMRPVVIGNGFGGVIFHEACAHALEATSVARGTSVFAECMGQQIASTCVTAVDDGTLPGEWGSIGVDDEGEYAARNVLIENGILRGYLVDRLNGRRMQAAPTGSCRRQGYDFAPTSRMTNTFLVQGSDQTQEMIATMGEGLYAKKLGGGSVNPMTGEFNFAVLEGYWVHDGKIVFPVRGATLIGRGTQVLKDIDRVGQDFALGQGMCGSSSGSIPVNVGQPTIRVRQMIIGGKGGAI